MRKFGIVALIIILFIISIISIFFTKSAINFSKNKDEGNNIVLAKEIEDESVKTGSNDVKVSPNAEVASTEYFQKCGHSVTKKELVPREIVNLSEDEVKEFYSDWSLDSFSPNEIKLSRKSSGICGEHYILRESDGFISISCKNESGEYIFKGLTDISVQYLPEEDLKKLEQGIEVEGREALNKFLEDFE